MWIMKEASTTNQPQPPSGGGAERAPVSPWEVFVSVSVAAGDFSLGGEALTGMSLVSTITSVLTGSSLSGPAILVVPRLSVIQINHLLTKKTITLYF